MTLTAETNDFSALTASRRSTRAFTDREIPAEVLDAILADATTAPSWSNTRAFRVGEDRVEDLGGDLPVRKGARRAARGGQSGKVVRLNVECHAPRLTRLHSPDPPGPPTGRPSVSQLVIPVQLSRDTTPSLQLRDTAVKVSKVGA